MYSMAWEIVRSNSNSNTSNSNNNNNNSSNSNSNSNRLKWVTSEGGSKPTLPETLLQPKYPALLFVVSGMFQEAVALT